MTNFDPVSYLMGQKAAGGGGGGSSTLSGLTDVDISNPTNGQTLVYNATSGKWENGAGGGGSLLITITKTTYVDDGWTYNRYETDRTVREIIEAGPTAYRVVYDEDEETYYYFPSIGYFEHDSSYLIIEYNYKIGAPIPMSVGYNMTLTAESMDSHLVFIGSDK